MVAATAQEVTISSITMLNRARLTTKRSGRAITGASTTASNRLSLMALRRRSVVARRRSMRRILPDDGVAFVAIINATAISKRYSIRITLAIAKGFYPFAALTMPQRN